jgi:hypothetical protein
MAGSHFVTALLCCAPVLAGCHPLTQTQPKDIPVSEVLSQLKLELAAFTEDTRAKDYTYKGGPRCGSAGTFKMAVKSVQVSLNTELSLTSGGDAGVTAPFGIATLGPSGGGSANSDNSEAITLNFTLDPNVVPAPGAKPSSLNLAKALAVLRDQIIAVAPDGQCLKFAADNNKIELAFKAEHDANAGIKLSIAVLSLDATTKYADKSGNTITVNLDFKDSGDLAPDAPPPPGLKPRK